MWKDCANWHVCGICTVGVVSEICVMTTAQSIPVTNILTGFHISS